jgi:hypothetical protein
VGKGRLARLSLRLCGMGMVGLSGGLGGPGPTAHSPSGARPQACLGGEDG